jgi:hypothetical protein
VMQSQLKVQLPAKQVKLQTCNCTKWVSPYMKTQLRCTRQFFCCNH